MRVILAAIALLAFMDLARPDGRSVLGGQASCGAWIADKGARAWHSNWIHGYLSGINMSSFDKPDMLDHVDDEAIAGWIDKHCRDNPLDLLARATILLSFELRRRASGKLSTAPR